MRAAALLLILLIVPAAIGLSTQITGVEWDSDMHVIHITLDSWPGKWDGWRFYLDGEQIPMEGGRQIKCYPPQLNPYNPSFSWLHPLN